MRTARTLTIIALMGSLFFMGSCKKKEEEKKEETSQTGCPDNANFCMKFGSEQISGNAELSEPPGGRVRVYWATTSGTYRQVELDIYGSAAGTFDVDTTYATGTAVFEYFDAGGTVTQGVSGTVTVDEFDPDGSGLSGSFSLTTDNGTTVTNGHFSNVAKP